MTTLVAVRKNGEAAIASDSQITSGGSAVSLSTPKVFGVGHAYLAFCGTVSNWQAIHHYIGKLPREPDLVTANDLFEFFLELHQALKDRYFMSPAEHSGMESTELGMLAITPKGVFSIDGDRCILEYRDFVSDGTGCDYARGAASVLYSTTMSALQIAVKAVKTSIKYDLHSGGPVQRAKLSLE